MKKYIIIFLLFACNYYANAQNTTWVLPFKPQTAQTINVYGITTDASKNVYAVGSFKGASDFNFNGTSTFTLTSSGGFDGFIAKYNSAGVLQWAKKIGGTLDDHCVDIELAGTNLVIGGHFASANVDFDPGTGTNVLSSSGNNDLFLITMDLNGNHVWSMRAGGTGNETLSDIMIDGNASNNIYISGTFGSALMDFFSNSNTVSHGGTDAFLCKLNSAGGFMAVKAIGGAGNDVGNKVTTIGAYVYMCSDIAAASTTFDPGSGSSTAAFSGTVTNGLVSEFDRLVTTSPYTNYIQMKGGTSTAKMALRGPNTSVKVFGTFNGTLDVDPSTTTAFLTSSGLVDGFIAEVSYPFRANTPHYGNIHISGNGSSSEFRFSDGVQTSTSTGTGMLYYLAGYVKGSVNVNSTTTLAGPSDLDDQAYIIRYSQDIGSVVNNLDFVYKDATVPASTTTSDKTRSNCLSVLSTYDIVTGGIISSTGAGSVQGTFNPGSFTNSNLTVGASSATMGYLHYISSCTPVTPSVAISTTSTTICSGASATFTATPTNGGSTPSYQWKVNGANVGTNSATYTTSSLTNGQVVNCVMTSNATCTSTSTATSNGITMTVSATVTPTISIAANASSICTGQSVTFTATATNGGSTPAYQWKINGTNAGTNSATFTTSSLTNGQVVSCVLTSNAICKTTATATSNSITMTVSSSATPSVAIVTSSSTICTGQSVTFTATPTNGGSSPVYQWKVNGTNTGTNSATFTTSSLTNGQVVSCVLTSNASCVSTTTATSNNITITVSSSVTPSITISTSTSTICAGQSATFTAASTNGGSSPSYQWKVNGTNAGTNSSSFTTSTLTNGQLVTCVLTSNASCASSTTATSNSVTMTVNSSVTPSVNIAASASTICAGQSVTFTATATNGGSNPTYQWKVNGTNTGTNSTTFTTSALTNGQVVSCVLTSNASCASTTTATSNNVTMTVNAAVTPSVSVAASASTICSGQSVTFTATATNGGSTPAYQWKVNGSNVGTNSTTFTSSTLTNGQIVSCTMTSNAACASPASVNSNNITMTVNSPAAPSVSVTASQTSICSGVTVTFTASATNGGSSPSYQWKLNGANVGTNSSSYSSNTLANNDQISCVLTSNATCVSTTTANSNTVTMTTTSITPAVSIAASSTTICSGQNITFTASPANGGSAPSYQWKVNGTNTGSNSATFTTSALTNGQVVSCVMTSNASCTTSSTATSNNISITVNASVSPSVAVSASSTTVCNGASVNFTATPTNGGSTPAYQWKVNGSNVGTNSATFTSSTLTNGQIVSCTMTSNAACASPASVNSNNITMMVNSPATPTITVTASQTSICSGVTVTFTASATNGGSSPSYQWKLNGANVGTNSSSYSSNTLANNDQISCVLTSNATCVSTTTANSNTITMTTTSITPAVSIAASSTTICSGQNITFTASPANGGSAPGYQWKIDGTNAGSNSATFTTSALTNGQVVSCIMNSNASCTTTSTATSNTIAITVNTMPSVAITLTGATLTATETGANYQWGDCTNQAMISGAISQSYTVTISGSYALIIEKNGCIDTSACIAVVVNKINQHQPVKNSVNVYPNPSTGMFVAEMPANTDILLYDLQGQLLIRAKTTEEKTIIDLKEYPNGFYLLKTYDGQNWNNQKLIKQE